MRLRELVVLLVEEALAEEKRIMCPSLLLQRGFEHIRKVFSNSMHANPSTIPIWEPGSQSIYCMHLNGEVGCNRGKWNHLVISPAPTKPLSRRIQSYPAFWRIDDSFVHFWKWGVQTGKFSSFTGWGHPDCGETNPMLAMILPTQTNSPPILKHPIFMQADPSKITHSKTGLEQGDPTEDSLPSIEGSRRTIIGSSGQWKASLRAPHPITRLLWQAVNHSDCEKLKQLSSSTLYCTIPKSSIIIPGTLSYRKGFIGFAYIPCYLRISLAYYTILYFYLQSYTYPTAVASALEKAVNKTRLTFVSSTYYSTNLSKAEHLPS